MSTISVPDLSGGPGEIAPPTQIRLLWRQCADLARQRRENWVRTRALQRQLGQLLARQQRSLAGTGRDGEFAPWLREHGFDRRQAYRLIARLSATPTKKTPRQPVNKKCDTVPLPPLPAAASPASSLPPTSFDGDRLLLNLSPKIAEVMRQSLPIIASHVPAFNLHDQLVIMVVKAVPAFAQQKMIDLLRSPDHLFAPRPSATNPLAIAAVA